MGVPPVRRMSPAEFLERDDGTDAVPRPDSVGVEVPFADVCEGVDLLPLDAPPASDGG